MIGGSSEEARVLVDMMADHVCVCCRIGGSTEEVRVLVDMMADNVVVC